MPHLFNPVAAGLADRVADEAAAVRRVAVEAGRLAAERRGISRYVRALLPRMAAARPDLAFSLHVEAADRGPVEDWVAACDTLRGRAVIRPLDALESPDADVVWFPWNVARVLPDHGTIVATMHDLSPIRVPRNAFSRWKWSRRYRATAHAARIILTVSEFSAREIRYLLGVPASRIHVVPLAAEQLPFAGLDDDARRLARLGVQSPYVLSVGGGDPRKRLDVLGAAMGGMAARVSGLSWVHAGPVARAGLPASAAARRMVGEVDDADLAALYRGALALAFPSVYEGFGLPLLEAMQAGTPVIAAHAAALPETGRDAVVWTHPGDALSLAHAIEAVATNPVFRARLSARGRAHAARFSWERAALQTLAAFDAAMPRRGKWTPPTPRPAAA